MKIISEAKVYLIGFTGYFEDEMERFGKEEAVDIAPIVEGEHVGEKLVEQAGRVCYMSYGKGRKTNREFLENLIASGHHSVLEHTNWSLLITGISRSLSHEFVRHRHFSYSQLSQRYVDSSDVAFVIPAEIAADAGLVGRWKAVLYDALSAYKLIEGFIAAKYEHADMPKTQRVKLARQAARSILPNAAETKMVVTGNARAWRHFLELRGSEHADVEIRGLAIKILAVLRAEAPTIFADYVVEGGRINVVRTNA